MWPRPKLRFPCIRMDRYKNKGKKLKGSVEPEINNFCKTCECQLAILTNLSWNCFSLIFFFSEIINAITDWLKLIGMRSSHFNIHVLSIKYMKLIISYPEFALSMKGERMQVLPGNDMKWQFVHWSRYRSKWKTLSEMHCMPFEIQDSVLIIIAHSKNKRPIGIQITIFTGWIQWGTNTMPIDKPKS